MTNLPDNRSYHPPEEHDAREAMLNVISDMQRAYEELDHRDWHRLNEAYKAVDDAVTLSRKLRDVHLPALMDEVEPDHGTCEVVTEREVRSGPLMGPAVLCGEPCEPETDYCAQHQPEPESVEPYDVERDREMGVAI